MNEKKVVRNKSPVTIEKKKRFYLENASSWCNIFQGCWNVTEKGAPSQREVLKKFCWDAKLRQSTWEFAKFSC